MAENMIHFFFIFDHNANSIVFSKPKSQLSKFKNSLAFIKQKTNFSKMPVLEKVITRYETFDLLMQKMQESILFGSFVKAGANKNNFVYDMFKKICEHMPQIKSLKGNSEFKTFVKIELLAFNKDKGDSLNKITNISLTIQKNLQNQIGRQKSNAKDLQIVSDEMEETKQEAAKLSGNANELKDEYANINAKIMLFIYGSIVLFFIIVI